MKIEAEPSVSLEIQEKHIQHEINQALLNGGVLPEKITSGDIRFQSVSYMIYWYHRLRNNKKEQERIGDHLSNYLGDTVKDPQALTNNLVSSNSLNESSKLFVENLMIPTKTVDLVVTKSGSDERKDKEVLCLERSFYPFGLSLPGGFIKDTDEDNPLNLPADVFAALRVAGEKVLGLDGEIHYSEGVDDEGKECYFVFGDANSSRVRLYPKDTSGYHYRENIKSTFRPSDPRHIVDTVAFHCQLEGDTQGLVWRNKSEIMSPNELTGGFAFGHHREIVAQITSQTTVEKERRQSERQFIRSILSSPLDRYLELKERFERNGNSPMTSFPELFPVVDKLITDAFSDEINALCTQTPLLAGVRDKAIISLRQVVLKNRDFCPYLPTFLAIAEGVAFFDIVARHKKGFYETMTKDRIVEHNPSTTPFASYHMYRYKYRFNQMLNMLPNEIVIPTFESLSATDLMRVRGVPIRFLGLATDFLYVDEFEQSPEEFFMHDANHSWRMIMEDKSAKEKYGKTHDQLIKESNEFLNDYLGKIKISKTDTEEEKELKKLKKIILFEIVHEDARPFLKEVICRFIQSVEGAPVPFEVPRIDEETGYMDIVDNLDTGISTLSYVRNKLQHGFYDQVDSQLPQIVGPKYRTAAWITKAAYDMLVELGATPEPDAELDEYGHVSYEWLLRRTCAVGPDNIHAKDLVDPDVEKFGDGAISVNPKRYQVGIE